MPDEEVKVVSQGDDLSLHVGDTVRTVIQDDGKKGDMVAFIDGTICFIKNNGNLDIGDTVRVKIADIEDDTIRAVAVGGGDA